jgi:hypothetical protein
MSQAHRIARIAVGLGVWLVSVAIAPLPAQRATKRILILAGHASHGPGAHEFKAGSMLLQKSLSVVPGVRVDVVTNDWPTKTVDGQTVDDNTLLDQADAIFIYADGGASHPINPGNRIAVLDKEVARGAGIGFGHYGVEVPVGPSSEALLRWIGGYYENNYSVNPQWAPTWAPFPSSPVTRGVSPFTNTDEWYFELKWTQDPALKARIVPILQATPSDDVRDGPYVSPRGPFPHVVADSGNVETLMWTVERANGRRGLGFTGGHTHTHWGDVNQRRLVANALLWLAKIDVPAGGVKDTITDEDLKLNLDDKPARRGGPPPAGAPGAGPGRGR